MKGSRATQRSRLLDLFKSRAGEWIPLPEILSLGFAQFGARILELRRDGHRIVNRTEHRDRKVLSWYRLDLSTPMQPGPEAVPKPQILPAVTLFGDLAPDRSYAE